MSTSLKDLKNKNIHIVGIGSAEGSAVGEFLISQGVKSITGHDFSEEKDFEKIFNNTHLSLKPKERKEALEKLLSSPIKINYKKDYLRDIEKADIIFVSQVWFKYPQNLPTLQKLKDKGLPFKTITNLYFELAPCPIIGITGANGKTTTARLINNIFKIWMKKNDKKAYFAGNDRQNVQVLDKLSEMTKDDVLILEISSTQLLLNSKISPHIGVITNITPNHLDDHGSFENYIEAKKNLIRYQGAGDWAVLNWDDVQSRKFVKSIKSKAFLFSRKEELEEGCFVKSEKIVINARDTKRPIGHLVSSNVICNINDIKIPGGHNLENALAAVSAAFLYGVDLKIIKEGITSYVGTKHRLKLLYNANGVKYYDDTQATTPEATMKGLDSFGEEIILIAGGDNKGMDYRRLAEKINNKTKLLILLPGNASDEIEKFIDKNKIDFAEVDSFSEAINFLKKYLKNKKTPNIQSDARHLYVVLISPAAAHFYSKYVENSGRSLKEWIKLVINSEL